MTKAELYKTVDKIRNYLNICKTKYPLNIFELCHKIDGLKIVRAAFKTKDLRGMLCVAENSNENSIILVNSNKSLLEQNYHGTHEFMHLFNDVPKAGTVIKCYDRVKPNQNRYVEWLANEGAAELLVPYKLFIPLFCSLYDMYANNYTLWKISYGNITLIQELADRFGVTTMVIRNRIKNLSYEIDQYKSGIDVNYINLLSASQQSYNCITHTDYDNAISKLELKYNFAIPWDGILSANY